MDSRCYKTIFLIWIGLVSLSIPGGTQSYEAIIDSSYSLPSGTEQLEYLNTYIDNRHFVDHLDTIALLYLEQSIVLFENDISIGKAIEAIDAGLALINKEDYADVWLECWYYKSYWYRKWDKYAEAKNAINKVLSYGESTKRWKATIQLGKIYKDRGDFTMALKTYDEAIILAGDDVYKLADTYEVISFVYLIMESEEGAKKAIHWLKKLVPLIESIEGYEHFTASMIYNIGTAYMTLEDYDTAFLYLNQSKIAMDKCCVDEDFESLLLESQGIMLLNQKKYDLAIEKYLEAIELYDESFDLGRSDGLASTYHHISSIYQEKGDIENAMLYIDMALGYRLAGVDSGIKCADISIERLRSNGEKHYLIDELLTKAKIIIDEYDKLQQKEILRHALMTLEQCDLLVDYMRTEHIDDHSKLFWRERTSEVYDLLVSVNYSLDDFDQAFHYAEKSKYLLTGEHLAQSHPTRLEELHVSRDLLSRYNVIQRELDKLSLHKQPLLSDSVLVIANRLRKDKDDILMELKSEYPEFYKANFSMPIATIDQIRESLISTNQSLIEFHTYDHTLYRFVINEDEVLMTKTDSVGDISNKVKALREILINPDRMAVHMLNSYSQVAYELYEVLFEDVFDHLAEDVIVVNDPILSLVPSSILLISPVNAENLLNIKEWPFLIKEKSIRQLHSASLALQYIRSEGYNNNGNHLLGLRPSYDEPVALLADNTEDITRDNYGPLIGAREEFQFLKSSIVGNYLEGEDATESGFKSLLKRSHAIIHIASHAIMDDSDPLNSRILLSQGDNEDGVLHAHEIQREEISADLIVLSACNTANGKNEKGEGVNSLGLAFAKAGSPNTLASLWSVNDKSTSLLMTKFYEYIMNREVVHRSIRKAQFDFLESQPNAYQHPYYWGGFAYFGEDISIELVTVESQSNPRTIFSWGLTFMVALSFFLFNGSIRRMYLTV